MDMTMDIGQRQGLHTIANALKGFGFRIFPGQHFEVQLYMTHLQCFRHMSSAIFFI